MMKNLVFILALVLLTGCAGSGKRMKSYTAESFPASSGAVMIQDMVDRVFAAYPPGQTSVFLSGKDGFALALEEALRDKGYAIVPDAAQSNLSVAWTVDRLDEESSWYLIVNLSGGYRFSRIYKDNGQMLEPAGGLSQGIF